MYIYCITSNVEAGLLAIGLGIINRKLTFIKDTPFSGLKLYSSGRTETLIVQGHSINIYGVNETHKKRRGIRSVVVLVWYQTRDCNQCNTFLTRVKEERNTFCSGVSGVKGILFDDKSRSFS